MRLFTAIPLPRSAEDQLRSLQSTETKGVRWQQNNHLHLTLVFIGNVKDSKAEEISHNLKNVAAAPFQITIRGVGVFPSEKNARVLWAGIDENEMLARLYNRVKDAVESCGVPLSDRPYIPHITLAKLKFPVRSFLNDYLSDYRDTLIDTVMVQQFELFESKLSPVGANHTRVAVYPLEITS